MRLLLLTTRRPEYAPPWVDRTIVTKLLLEPLPIGDIRNLIRARPGVGALPESFAWQVAEKAEGNPLFAEEIASFLSERGLVRTTTGKLDFDATVVATALPASVQSLLAARVDRLAPNDRALLQAASVIGRQFEPQLLAVVVGNANIYARLTAMQALDLVYRKSKSADYSFKHALVRDALYQSLLGEARTALHLKIAEEIERRSGNRLIEVAEVLAHHYSQTDRAEKAFAYLSMAGSKSLSVYSLGEAANHFTAALALLDKQPDCASDDQVAEFLVPYTLLLNMCNKIKATITVLSRYQIRIDRLGLDQRVVLIRHNYVFALLWNSRYRDATVIQQEASPIASRLGDGRSKAYSLAGEMLSSTLFAPKTPDEFGTLKKEASKALSETADAYIHNWMNFVIGWDEFHRGRMTEARDRAYELMRTGKQLNDPRSTGLGLVLLTWIALIADSYTEALEYSEQALAVAATPFDRTAAVNGKGGSLVLLRRTEEGLKLLEESNRRCAVDGDLYVLVGNEGIVAVGKVLQGNISEGIRLLEERILRLNREGYRTAADWYRFFLSEVYLQIIGGKEKPPFATLLKNLPVLVKVIVTAPSRIPALIKSVKDNPHFDPAGYHAGHAELILGLFYKQRKRRDSAIQHLSEAKRLLSPFGVSPLLARVDAGLAELRK